MCGRWIRLESAAAYKEYKAHKRRSRHVYQRLLEGYSSYLQADGYAGYEAVCREQGITLVGCWDHARRKFKEAQDAQPKKKKNTAPSKADMVLQMIGKLYRIEREIAELDPEGKYQQRQALSIPALEKLKAWADKHHGKMPKDSLTGQAMFYLRNQWPKLVRYCEDGRLPISNCMAENAIRPFVVGRKAWLFADTPKGAQASAIYYSLIESAKTNGLDPYAYLRQVLAQLPYADSVEKYEALLPWNIKLAGG